MTVERPANQRVQQHHGSSANADNHRGDPVGGVEVVRNGELRLGLSCHKGCNRTKPHGRAAPIRGEEKAENGPNRKQDYREPDARFPRHGENLAQGCDEPPFPADRRARHGIVTYPLPRSEVASAGAHRWNALGNRLGSPCVHDALCLHRTSRSHSDQLDFEPADPVRPLLLLGLRHRGCSRCHFCASIYLLFDAELSGSPDRHHSAAVTGPSGPPRSLLRPEQQRLLR